MAINRSFITSLMAIGALAALLTIPHNVAASEAEVRETVQRVFQQLKGGEYPALYASLPKATKTRISQQRFTNALKRAQNMYVLDRMDVGQIRLSGNMAVVDTVLYGRLIRPFETEGKIVVQQYLVKEAGKWRVATGDQATIKQFLASNPAFGRKFPVREPKIYVLQNGNWVEFNLPQASRRKVAQMLR